MLEVTASGFTDYPGTYDAYVARHGAHDHLDADAVVLKAKRDAASSKDKTNQTQSWEEKKRQDNRRKQLPKLRDAALAAVEAAEARKAAIAARFCEDGFFERTPKAEVDALEAEDAALGPKIEALMAEWEALEGELASAP